MSTFVFFSCKCLILTLASLALTVQSSAEIQFNRDVDQFFPANASTATDPPKSSARQTCASTSPRKPTLIKDGFAAIVPGSTDDSEAWHRIMSDDPDEIMPPPESKKEMTEEEKEIITKWIEQGAKWEGHWSYLPVTKPAIPETSDKKWAKNEIDHFILAKLDDLGMKPSPEADRRTLIRRLYLDLTGLPPDLQR